MFMLAHTHTDAHTQGAMLSPNVINAVKRLTSGYLFKSRHQTHSFFFFISTDHRSYCQGRKAPSDQLSVQRGRPNKARAFSTTLSLSFIIYRGSVPRPHRPPREQGRSLSGRTMDSRAGGGRGLIVMDDVTLTPPGAEQRVGWSRVRAGGKMLTVTRGVRVEGPGDVNGECVCVCVFMVQQNIYSHAQKQKE